VIGLLNTSLSGTDGNNDGWLVVIAALVGVGSLALYVVGGKGIGAVGALLAGAAGAAVTIYDRGNISDLADESSTDLALIEIGWGLNLAMGASIVLALSGLIALLGGKGTKASELTLEKLEDEYQSGAWAPEKYKTKKAELLAERIYRECPFCKEDMRRDASVCPHCRNESKPWQLYEGRWWRRTDDGTWYWLEEISGEWQAVADSTRAEDLTASKQGSGQA
jgi:hypothetical protein